MSRKCHSCAITLKPENKERKSNYCRYCSDGQGNLLPREQVQKNIADWLAKWAPNEGAADFMKRAEYYMKSMPVWAKE